MRESKREGIFHNSEYKFDLSIKNFLCE